MMRLYLLHAERQEEEIPGAMIAADVPSGQREVILVIEDDPGLLMINTLPIT